MKKENRFIWFAVLAGFLSGMFAPPAYTQSCEVGDTTAGKWKAMPGYDRCTPPTTLVPENIADKGWAFGGNYMVYYITQIIGNCGINGGAMRVCDGGCIDRGYICPLGNEVVPGTISLNCQGPVNCSMGLGEKVYQAGCCISRVEAGETDLCTYSPTYQYIFSIYVWVCDTCSAAYTAKVSECSGAQNILTWDNATCTGTCRPCIAEYEAKIAECGSAQKIVNWNDVTCTGECLNPGQNLDKCQN